MVEILIQPTWPSALNSITREIIWFLPQGHHKQGRGPPKRLRKEQSVHRHGSLLEVREDILGGLALAAIVAVSSAKTTERPLELEREPLAQRNEELTTILTRPDANRCG